MDRSNRTSFRGNARFRVSHARGKRGYIITMVGFSRPPDQLAYADGPIAFRILCSLDQSSDHQS
jgi:hypothetical protein